MIDTLAAGTRFSTPAGTGKILCLYDDNGVDMVEVLWDNNMVSDMREDEIRNSLTHIWHPAKGGVNPWAALAAEN